MRREGELRTIRSTQPESAGDFLTALLVLKPFKLVEGGAWYNMGLTEFVDEAAERLNGGDRKNVAVTIAINNDNGDNMDTVQFKINMPVNHSQFGAGKVVEIHHVLAGADADLLTPSLIGVVFENGDMVKVPPGDLKIADSTAPSEPSGDPHVIAATSATSATDATDEAGEYAGSKLNDAYQMEFGHARPEQGVEASSDADEAYLASVAEDEADSEPPAAKAAKRISRTAKANAKPTPREAVRKSAPRPKAKPAQVKRKR